MKHIVNSTRLQKPLELLSLRRYLSHKSREPFGEEKKLTELWQDLYLDQSSR